MTQAYLPYASGESRNLSEQAAIRELAYSVYPENGQLQLKLVFKGADEKVIFEIAAQHDEALRYYNDLLTGVEMTQDDRNFLRRNYDHLRLYSRETKPGPLQS